MGTLAVVAVAAGLVLPYLGSGRDAAPATDPESSVSVTSSDVSWVTGSVLHTPTKSVDLGHDVLVYVTTTVGVVFVDRTDTVWSATANGVVAVGHVDGGDEHLAATPGDSRVGWVGRGVDRPAFTVFDQASGAIVTDDRATRPYPPVDSSGNQSRPDEFLALDGTTAYVRDDLGTQALDMSAQNADDAPSAVLPRGSRDTVLGAANGLIAFDPADSYTELGRTRATARPLLGDSDTDTQEASFSPDGRYLVADADDLRVFDTATRHQTPLTAKGYDFAAGYGWLDDTTVLAVAARTDNSNPVLLACTVPDGGCRVAASDVGTFDTLRLPVGALPD